MHVLFEILDLERFKQDGDAVLLHKAFLFSSQGCCGAQDQGDARGRWMCFEVLEKVPTSVGMAHEQVYNHEVRGEAFDFAHVFKDAVPPLHFIPLFL